MTPQQLNAMKLALEALEGVLDDAPKVLDASIAGGLYEVVQCRDAITAIKEALLEHAMQEVQRLGQEIEQCQCPECQIKPHASDCAVHSEPAYPKGKCDCGAQPQQEPHGWYIDGYGAVIGTAEPKSVRVGEWLPWYTAPPQRTWVGLMDEEIEDCYKQGGIGRAIQLFKEKNT